MLVVGNTCPYCQTVIKPGVPSQTCPACAVPHHAECWQHNGGCTTYGCQYGSSGQSPSHPLPSPPLPIVPPSTVRARSRAPLYAALTAAAILLLLIGIAVGRMGPRSSSAMPPPPVPAGESTGAGDAGEVAVDPELEDTATVSPAEVLQQRVEEWRASWERQDVEGHVACYSPYGFTVDGGARSAESFANEHRRENEKQPTMTIGVSDLQVQVFDEVHAKTVFRQTFRGVGTQSKWNWESGGTRRLVWERDEGEWRIVEDDFEREWGNRF